MQVNGVQALCIFLYCTILCKGAANAFLDIVRINEIIIIITILLHTNTLTRIAKQLVSAPNKLAHAGRLVADLLDLQEDSATRWLAQHRVVR